jgi:C4-dicarboxylate-specific signal transduction histidine kinase
LIIHVKSYRVAFMLIGALFGILFPITATLLDIWLQGSPLSLGGVIEVQRAQPLHWIIDSAPLFLGYFASFAGQRQDLLTQSLSEQLATNLQLESEINERKKTEELIRSTLQERDRLAKQFEWLIASMPIGLGVYDKEGHILSSNEVFKIFTGGDENVADAIFARAILQTSGSKASELEIIHDSFERFAYLARLDQETEGKIWVLLADVTEQKIQEKQLLQASKLVTLGELATSIAHEINQPLNHIALLKANMHVLLSQSSPAIKKIQSKLEKMDTSITRAAKITDHMRAFGRIDMAEFKPASIVNAIDGALMLFDSELRDTDIKVEVEIESGLPKVKAIEMQLEQVFLNLFSNARDAIKASGAAIRIIFIAARVHDQFVVIEVKDTGPGMSQEQLSKIFEPFYTTKEVGAGTGLGGSVSYNIITGFGGLISAMNWKGTDDGLSGAKISIKLPRLVDDTLPSDI